MFPHKLRARDGSQYQRLLTVAKWGRFMVWRILERSEAVVDDQGLSDRLRTLSTDTVDLQAAKEAVQNAST